ncbi:MAG: hypothetical protein DRN27_01385 [Thermoplasmata archaeon]|nr:MAG: hypothetical protein DRN27_01385 [Thermoplasmata archaeon]
MKLGKMKIKAFVIALFFIGTMIVPINALHFEKNNEIEQMDISDSGITGESEQLPPWQLDTKHIKPNINPASLNSEDNMDMGTKRDAGDSMRRATVIYPGEPIDNTPGRGTTAEFSSGSDEDWYCFSVCEGQQISVSASGSTDLLLKDINEEEKASGSGSLSFTAEYTGNWYLLVKSASGSGFTYILDVDLNSQNDAGLGSDAGDSISQASSISIGEYYGYLDMNDEQDWYSFNVNNGDGLHFLLEMKSYAYYSDFDISLYNPSNELVYSEKYYYDDELFYTADVSGTWKIKIDIFPGYTNVPYAEEFWEYYSYGSGAYKLTFSIEDDIPENPPEIPQAQITPIAKSFFINNDPLSSKDEYGYIAAIPAANYFENGARFLAPIFYQGDETSTSWFGNDDGLKGTVDTTTQYLIDDWNAYLSTHDVTANEYIVPSDPIAAAAEIATTNWESSNLAVIAIDGSIYQDEVETVVQTTTTLNRNTKTTVLQSDDESLYANLGHTINIKEEWCALTVDIPTVTKTYGGDGCNLVTNLWPSYMDMACDWWPTTYDGAGNATDVFIPIASPGIWSVSSPLSPDDYDQYIINQLAGHRYDIDINGDDAIKVKVETDEESDLLVFLVDPDGKLRAPDIPKWNGPIIEIHEWCGLEQPAYNPWREWNPEPHTEFSAEVLHPEEGTWTLIVVPRYEEGPDYTYTVTADVVHINEKRADAAVSAANAAIIASQEHAPLLYVSEESVPSATSQALTQLGVSSVIFVERGNIGSTVKGSLPSISKDLTSMQDIIDQIKGYSNTENYITIASIKSGEGYIAPAAMVAAYHCSPLLRIGEAPGNPAGVADRIETWRLWEGDYYHGSRSTGHLPEHTSPLSGEGKWTLQTIIQAALFLITSGNSGEIPPLGMDAKRYWNEEMYDGVYNWINGFGLDNDGKEAYCIVADREDINLPLHSVLMGNKSYAGHIPGITPAYVSAVSVRNILYPALIYANENRDVTTAQMMNFADGGMWTTNDGVSTNAYSSRTIKSVFNSHGRNFEGHCLWDAHLKRMNDGASLMYYAGHGTGGSGISAQYYQTEHCNYPEQIWWDAWRGYSDFDNWKIARDNGRSWYNAEQPSLYDIVHFDHVDRLFENLHSMISLWLSCTTADGYGPMVYLDHGAVCYFGNAGSGLTPQEDLMDNEVFMQAFMYGDSISYAFSNEVWRHLRDYTTGDPTAMYGTSSIGLTTMQCIYCDPALIGYSPEWTNPIPIEG